MNRLASTAVQQITAETGCAWDPVADFDDLAELDRLAAAVTSQTPSAYFRAAMRPHVQVGNVTLHRLTMGATEWLRDADAWTPPHTPARMEAQIFALANARTPEVLWRIRGKAELDKALRAWRRTAGATFEELAEGAVEIMADQEEPPAGPPTPNQEAQPPSRDHGWMIELLCSEYGQTVDHWLWRAPLAEINLLLSHHARRLESQRRAMARARGAKEAEAPDPSDRYIQDLRLFRVHESALRARKSAETHPPEAP
jgi:hypothetical protein